MLNLPCQKMERIEFPHNVDARAEGWLPMVQVQRLCQGSPLVVKNIGIGTRIDHYHICEQTTDDVVLEGTLIVTLPSDADKQHLMLRDPLIACMFRESDLVRELQARGHQTDRLDIWSSHYDATVMVNDQQAARERLLFRYHLAMQGSDDATIDEVLKAAETDSILEQMIFDWHTVNDDG